MSLSAVLFVVFLVLKLTGVIAWSWLWVTAPLWIGFLVALPFMLLQVVVAGATVRKVRRF